MQIVLEFEKIASERALRNIIAGERQEEVSKAKSANRTFGERDSETTTLMIENVSSLDS